MNIPGFAAEASLYVTNGRYRTTGAAVQTEGNVLPALQGIPLEMAAPYVNYPTGCEGKRGGRSPVDFGEAIGINTKQTVFPMSVPGHRTDLSGQCNACQNLCIAGGFTCAAAADTACAGLLAIPFAGPALFVACVGVATVGCEAATAYCIGNCSNIGSACCPVACGVSCCDSSETCLDTGQGLCCSAGTLPCLGPQESCYDPRTERCLPSGVGCPFGQECGNVCCPSGLTCKEGVCCRPEQKVCNGVCCDGPCDQNGDCCEPPSRLCGSVCCPPFNECCLEECCELGQHCHPTLRTCCSNICGPKCCRADQLCQDRTTGLCGSCPQGTGPCDSVGPNGVVVTTCCPPGANCCLGQCCTDQTGHECTGPGGSCGTIH